MVEIVKKNFVQYKFMSIRGSRDYKEVGIVGNCAGIIPQMCCVLVARAIFNAVRLFIVVQIGGNNENL
jgi:hypothetical protein